MFEISRNSPLSLVDQLVERIAGHILDGRLTEGSRLPSIRKLAGLTGASPFTVAEAYDRLVARGLIESRAGRGFFVARRPVGALLAAIEAAPDPSTDALALARAAHARQEDVIAPGSGFLPESWLMEVAPGVTMTRLARNRRPSMWMPCSPQGLPELREQIAARLTQRGIVASSAHIVTTFGASQAFDLIGRLLFTPGDAVLVEDPGYFVLFEQLRAHHVRLVPVPRQAGGPDVDALENACRTHRPRALFTQTLLHNPTGTNTEPARCHRILSLAEQYGFAIVEDDVYGDLYDGPAVRLAQIDGLRHVLYVGSFTKLISPALRTGFIAADPAVIAQLVERKLISVLSGSALLETFVSEVLASGRYHRHIEALRPRLARARRDARRLLESAGIVFDDPGGEGLFLWGRLPDTADVDEVLRSARERSILLARGSLFSPCGGASRRLRFNAPRSIAPELGRFLAEAVR